MKRITPSIDERVLAGARRFAAEHDTTVNSLVRENLAQIAQGNDRTRPAMHELREMSDRSNTSTGPVSSMRSTT